MVYFFTIAVLYLCVTLGGVSSQGIPSLETPAPETPAPETPAPETPAPETPAPETPAPETPAPETRAPETPAPETPAPETPAPETPAPETRAPGTLAPETPPPRTTTPRTPAPGTTTPRTTNPETPATETHAPETPASGILASETPPGGEGGVFEGRNSLPEEKKDYFQISVAGGVVVALLVMAAGGWYYVRRNKDDKEDESGFFITSPLDEQPVMNEIFYESNSLIDSPAMLEERNSHNRTSIASPNRMLKQNDKSGHHPTRTPKYHPNQQRVDQEDYIATANAALVVTTPEYHESGDEDLDDIESPIRDSYGTATESIFSRISSEDGSDDDAQDNPWAKAMSAGADGDENLTDIRPSDFSDYDL